MSIVALLGVKDEVELIGLSMAHLRRIGVDRICVVDYGSTDGTLDIVAAERRRHGDVSLAHIDPDLVVDYESSSAHDLALARATGAEWVLVLDADEFWLPVSGSLRTCESLWRGDIVVAERYNVALAANRLLMPSVLAPQFYNRLQLMTRHVPHFRRFVEMHPEEPFITVAPGHKVIGRLTHAAAITPGGHDLTPASPQTRRIVAPDIVVAHVAFSTWPRFERKVANIRSEIVRHPALFAGDLAWHWRRWAGLGDRDLRLEFERQRASAEQLVHWQQAGYLQTAAEVLHLSAPRAWRDAASADFSMATRSWTALRAPLRRLRLPLPSAMRF